MQQATDIPTEFQFNSYSISNALQLAEEKSEIGVYQAITKSSTKDANYKYLKPPFGLGTR